MVQDTKLEAAEQVVNKPGAPPKPGHEPEDLGRPRLTPQGRDAPEGEDATDPAGGAKTGQGDKAEG